MKKPLFPSAPCSDSMTTPNKPFSLLWRPNNYRRQMRVGLKTNSTLKALLRTIGTMPTLSYNYSEHTKLLFIRGWRRNITMQYGKETITAIWSQSIIGGHKETFFIEAGSIAELQERIDIRKKDIQDRIDEAIISFAKFLRVHLPFEKAIWVRHEDWIKGEEYIDKIPKEVIIHDTIFKKVYGEGIEFIGGKNDEPVAKIKNYIKNRAVEDIAPELAKAINSMVDTFKNEALKPLTAEIRTHLALLRQEIKHINKKPRKRKYDRQEGLRRWL